MRVLMMIALLILISAMSASAQTPVSPPAPARNQIVTSGMGRVEAMPNQAVVTLGVQIQRRTASEAMSEANRIAERMLSRLAALAIPRADIRTSGVQVFPVYTSAREGGEAQVSGYRASHTITVTINDLTKVGPAIDAGVEAGANVVHGISFGLRDTSGPRREALAIAVKEAREKADAIAQAAGLRIRGIEQIVESGVGVTRFEAPPPAIVPGPRTATPIEPGVVTVTGTVTVIFTF
jgi:uncharacterized protein YggE